MDENVLLLVHFRRNKKVDTWRAVNSSWRRE